MSTDYCSDAPGPCSHHWQPFGTNVDRPGPLEFRGEDEAGMPTQERGVPTSPEQDNWENEGGHCV